MSDLRAAYDSVLYQSFPREATSPDRIAAVATLFGMDRPDPETARVLEIGCSDAGNLLSLAATTPNGTFVGIDFAESAIENGKARLAEQELRNVTLERMDIADFPEDAGSFDYIIAHGVYSWVSSDTRTAILNVVQRHLSPTGVAYIDYNAQPGSHLRYAFRESMFFHVRQFEQPQQRIDQARALLKLIIEANPPASLYRLLAEQETQRLQRTPDYVIFHDDLSEHNEAFYFHEFVATAATHGLQFLAEADVSTMNPARLPDKVRERLAGLAKLTQMEQYLDILTHRGFRQTLLCRTGRKINRSLNGATLEGLRFSSRVNVSPGQAEGELVFQTEGATLATTNRLAQAVMESLKRHTGRRLTLPELATEVQAVLGQPETEVETPLRAVVLHCIMSGLVEIHSRATPPHGN